jgi:hypothetical protein
MYAGSSARCTSHARQVYLVTVRCSHGDAIALATYHACSQRGAPAMQGRVTRQLSAARAVHLRRRARARYLPRLRPAQRGAPAMHGRARTGINQMLLRRRAHARHLPRLRLAQRGALATHGSGWVSRHQSDAPPATRSCPCAYHACIPHSAVHLPRKAGLLGSYQLP